MQVQTLETGRMSNGGEVYVLDENDKPGIDQRYLESMK